MRRESLWRRTLDAVIIGVDRRNKGLWDTIDYALLWVMLALIAFGILMVYSATASGREMALVWENGVKVPDSAYFLRRSCVFAAFSLILSFFLFRLPMNTWQKWSPHILGLALLLMLLLPFIGKEIGDTRRWISIGGFISVQPAEILKFAVVLYLSDYLMRHVEELDDITKIWGITVPIGLGMGLIYLSEDLGSFVIVGFLTVVVLVVAGIPWKWVFVCVLIGLASVFAIIAFTPWRLARIYAFLSPESDPYGVNYQLNHALSAEAMGGWAGRGLGNGLERYYLSEIHTDFIFSLVFEEWGYVGSVFLILVFFWLIWRIFAIGYQAHRNRRYYASYCAKGIALWFLAQFAIHVAVNIGLFPTKGLTLPFISYGGSSVLMSTVALAVVLRIDYENRRKARGHGI